MKILRLLRVSLTVADLSAATTFYEGALGFAAAPSVEADPVLAHLLGAERLRTMQLTRGGQILELAAFDPAGAPYPADSRSNDGWFQHCALPVPDMDTAYARLCCFRFTPISAGPQRLPARAGGVTAYKFRDPEGHPLELIHFPGRPGADGIDHSAIAVADAGRSIAFYAGLGLRVGSQAVNSGPEQDALDGLGGVQVDVVGLMPPAATPHLELLGYRTPPGRTARVGRPADVASTRLVFAASGLAGHEASVALADGSRAALLHDPDGHTLLLIEGA